MALSATQEDQHALLGAAADFVYHLLVLLKSRELSFTDVAERLALSRQARHSAGRWFEGFGRFFAIRRPMDTGDATQPFDPDKPTVITFNVPFNNPGFAPRKQGIIGRAELLNKSYAEYEKGIVAQMTKMFADHGFAAEEDIAGIVLNRWGHAYISPQPGFHFGKDGKPAASEIVRKGFMDASIAAIPNSAAI